MNLIYKEGYRLLGYIVGFFLFFGPFAVFQRTLSGLFMKETTPTIHSLCFRIPIEHILNGQIFSMGLIAILGLLFLLIVSFVFGPLFCGHLCPAGAAPEYVSKLVPRRFKINWGRWIAVTPLRYGFLAGFLLAPFTGAYLACSYCNYYVFDLLVNYVLCGYVVAFSTSQLLTLLLWSVFMGAFTQGGRGFCNFFCPVGALQNLIYTIGCRFSFAWKLAVDPNRCNQCGLCAKVCPMTSLQVTMNGIERNKNNCILCFECMRNCHRKAISYKNDCERR